MVINKVLTPTKKTIVLKSFSVKKRDTLELKIKAHPVTSKILVGRFIIVCLKWVNAVHYLTNSTPSLGAIGEIKIIRSKAYGKSTVSLS